MFELLTERIANFIPVLLSLTVHEWAHAWTALKLGDDTALRLGRVSLNPIDHIDPIGTLLLPLLGVPFGWAKPVPVNPLRFRQSVSMSKGMMIVAAAGPLSNIILAILGCLTFAGFVWLFPLRANNPNIETLISIVNLLHIFVLINVLLACFNLLPIPPLDGSKIADALMPRRFRRQWEQFAAQGPILLVAVLVLPGLMGFSLFYWPQRGVDMLLSWLITR